MDSLVSEEIYVNFEEEKKYADKFYRLHSNNLLVINF